MACLREAVQRQFDDVDANPRGITVVFEEQLIFEQYSEAVDATSRLIGWSATKSVRASSGERISERNHGPHISLLILGLILTLIEQVVNALIGLVVGDGGIDVMEPAPVPEWQGPGDARAAITTGAVFPVTFCCCGLSLQASN